MPIKIVAKKEGYRRAGLAHSGTRYYEDGHFSATQLAALEAEPNLDVSHIDEMPPGVEADDSDGKPGKAAGKKK